MPTFYAQNGGQTTPPVARAHSAGRTAVTFNMTPVVVAQDDVIVLCVLDVANADGANSLGLWVHEVVIEIPGWDSSTGIQFDVGDQTSRTTFLSNIQLGRSSTAGVISSTDTAAAASGTTSGSFGRGVFPRKYTANNDIRLTFDAAATTLVTTNPLRGYVVYTLEESI